MKRVDLIQTIEGFGCELVRHGGKHDWYRNPATGLAQAVPRHRESRNDWRSGSSAALATQGMMPGRQTPESSFDLWRVRETHHLLVDDELVCFTHPTKNHQTMAYWLFKSEPNCYAFADLLAAPDRTTGWDGVRNFSGAGISSAMR